MPVTLRPTLPQLTAPERQIKDSVVRDLLRASSYNFTPSDKNDDGVLCFLINSYLIHSIASRLQAIRCMKKILLLNLLRFIKENYSNLNISGTQNRVGLMKLMLIAFELSLVQYMLVG